MQAPQLPGHCAGRSLPPLSTGTPAPRPRRCVFQLGGTRRTPVRTVAPVTVSFLALTKFLRDFVTACPSRARPPPARRETGRRTPPRGVRGARVRPAGRTPTPRRAEPAPATSPSPEHRRGPRGTPARHGPPGTCSGSSHSNPKDPTTCPPGLCTPGGQDGPALLRSGKGHGWGTPGRGCCSRRQAPAKLRHQPGPAPRPPRTPVPSPVKWQGEALTLGPSEGQTRTCGQHSHALSTVARVCGGECSLRPCPVFWGHRDSQEPSASGEPEPEPAGTGWVSPRGSALAVVGASRAL